MNLLTELLFITESRVTALRDKLLALKAERKKLLATHAASSNQSAINPLYAPQVKRLDAAISAVGHELTAELAKPQVDQELRAAERKRAETAVKADPGDAIKAGVKHWLDLADKYGNEHLLNVAIKNAATKQTQNGFHPLDINSLSKEFDVTANAMYRRINQMHELHPLKRWYPKPK